MTGMMVRAGSTDFRWQLKAATQSAHDDLDRLISGLDLQQRPDLTRFFVMHLIAFKAMRQQRPDRALIDTTDALEADIAVLTDGLPIGFLPEVAPYHPLAGQYLISGSRMGTKVLMKTWARSADPRVRAASHYFHLPISRFGWPEVCTALNAVGRDSPDAAHIVADTKRLFALFRRAYEAATVDPR